VNKTELPVSGQYLAHVKKRLGRLVLPVVTAAALTASLTAVAAAPAGAAVQQPTRTAATSVASSDIGLPDVSLKAAARYVHFEDGRFAFEARQAQRHGVSGKAIESEGIMVGTMNALLDSRIAAVNKAHDGVAFDTTRAVGFAAKAVHASSKATQADAKAVQADAKGLNITVLNGITISVNTTGIQIVLSKAAATEIENLAAIAANITPFVGAVVGLILVASAPAIAGALATTGIFATAALALAALTPLIPGITAIITAVLNGVAGFIGNLVKLCSASNGTATFTIPWPGNGLPSCSGLSGL
jgi:hypothetical protein